jgi:hypothetical protein
MGRTPQAASVRAKFVIVWEPTSIGPSEPFRDVVDSHKNPLITGEKTHFFAK